MNIWIAFAFGLLVGVGLALRVAQVALAEIRTIFRIVYEMKRRMSVARIDNGRVSFKAGGDPEKNGAAIGGYLGGGDVLSFLWTGYAHTKASEDDG